MSNVDTAKMLIPAFASGAAIDSRMPVSEKSSGPSTFSARQPLSDFQPAGILSSGRIKEVSSPVRVIDQNGRRKIQRGMVASGGSEHIASFSELTDILKFIT